MIFETLKYWKQFCIPIIKIDKLNYISVDEVNDILDPAELKLSDMVYNTDVTKLLNTFTYSDKRQKENESFELFIPIEKLNNFISIK